MDEVLVYRRRPVVSLVMMLFALFLGAGGYLLTGLNQTGSLPTNWIAGCAIWLVLGLVAWTVTRIRLPYADPLLLPCVFLLNGLGLSMIYRLDQADGLRSAELQLAWTAASVVAF